MLHSESKLHLSHFFPLVLPVALCNNALSLGSLFPWRITSIITIAYREETAF